MPLRAVFGLELGPVTVTVPAGGEALRVLSRRWTKIITVAMFYGPGTYSFSFDNVSTLRPHRRAHHGRSGNPRRPGARPRIYGRPSWFRGRAVDGS